jgi:hypothetical protein
MLRSVPEDLDASLFREFDGQRRAGDLARVEVAYQRGNLLTGPPDQWDIRRGDDGDLGIARNHDGSR